MNYLFLKIQRHIKPERSAPAGFTSQIRPAEPEDVAKPGSRKMCVLSIMVPAEAKESELEKYIRFRLGNKESQEKELKGRAITTVGNLTLRTFKFLPSTAIRLQESFIT